MPDGGGERDDFDSVLRGLAAEGETSPALTGSQIRRRGEARGRRRRVAASAAVTVLLVGGAAVAAPRLLGERQPSGPVVPEPTPTTGSAVIAACSQDALSFSVENQDGKGEPVRHLLVTVTNTGGKKCNVYHYPHILIGNAQAPAPVIPDSDPKALATLAPGEQAHAALLVRGGKMDEYEANTLTVTLQGHKPGSNTSKPITVSLPPGTGTLFADDGQRVTYWMTASGLALRFIMSR